MPDIEIVDPVNKCGTKTCHNQATDFVLWPGQHLKMCPACTERAKRIGDAMGFSVPVQPLPLTPIVKG